MREAPSRKLIDELLQIGATVQAFDPAAMKEAERIYGENSQFKLFVDKYVTLNKADVLVICTEWNDFRAPNFVEMANRMSSQIIIDGRNIYQPVKLNKLGWTYISIGRKSI
jgi:UDPglucose 6-dehydrogenase